MSSTRRFVRCSLVIAALRVCVLLALAVSVTTSAGPVKQSLVLVPGPNASLSGVSQVTTGKGYVTSLKEIDDTRLPMELSPPRGGVRHLATVSADQPPAVLMNLMAVSNLVRSRIPGMTQAPQAAGLALGQVSDPSDKVHGQSPVAATRILSGSAVNVPPGDPGGSGDGRRQGDDRYSRDGKHPGDGRRPEIQSCPGDMKRSTNGTCQLIPSFQLCPVGTRRLSNEKCPEPSPCPGGEKRVRNGTCSPSPLCPGGGRRLSNGACPSLPPCPGGERRLKNETCPPLVENRVIIIPPKPLRIFPEHKPPASAKPLVPVPPVKSPAAQPPATQPPAAQLPVVQPPEEQPPAVRPPVVVPVIPASVTKLIPWLWLAIVALILLTIGLLALLADQVRKGQKWVSAHVSAIAGADPGVGVEVMESRTDYSPPSCVVRLESHADSGTQVLEEVRS